MYPNNGLATTLTPSLINYSRYDHGRQFTYKSLTGLASALSYFQCLCNTEKIENME